MDAWNKFVHEHGEVEGYREARIAIKRKTMQLSMQWDQQVRSRLEQLALVVEATR